MREYQLQGLNWMIHLYDNGVNGILADEMVGCLPACLLLRLCIMVVLPACLLLLVVVHAAVESTLPAHAGRDVLRGLLPLFDCTSRTQQCC
jgi:hypothetical protein